MRHCLAVCVKASLGAVTVGCVVAAPEGLGWFARVFVDPANKDHLYVPGVNMYQSTNGATSFSTCCGSVHADQHIVVWDTHSGGDSYIGNDGGLYASNNGGTSWTK